MRFIRFPVFLAARDFTADLFWKKIFENLAYGETPRGIYIHENTIYSVTKKKEFNYSFAGKSVEQIYEDIHNLFGSTYGLKSKSDLSRKRELFEQFQQINSVRKNEDLWSKIKRKTLKDNLIQDFVIESQQKYKLSDEQTKKMYFYIAVGSVFKMFTGSDIALRGGSIQSVQGVDLSEGNVTITRRFTEPVIKRGGSTSHQYLRELWESYLKTLS